eukprot:4309456-Prymnesium_polylepis.1
MCASRAPQVIKSGSVGVNWCSPNTARRGEQGCDSVPFWYGTEQGCDSVPFRSGRRRRCCCSYACVTDVRYRVR